MLKAKQKFQIKVKFDVHKTTIQSRIKAGNLTVWSPGEDSLVLGMEVMLNCLIITAWETCTAITIGECHQIANNLIEGTAFVMLIIERKKRRGLYDRDELLLGWGWVEWLSTTQH